MQTTDNKISEREKGKEDIPLENNWSRCFEKSLSENAQLVFSKKVTISTINPEDNIPYSEILDIQEIKNFESKNSAMVFYVDNRTIFYKILTKNSIVNVINFFPLTREKFKMNCLVFSISGAGEEDSIVKINNIIQFKNFMNLNYKYNKSTHSKMMSKSDEEYSQMASEYFTDLSKELTKEKISDILNCYWSKLNNEEKLDYETVDKDSIKCNEGESKLNKNIENFEAQEEMYYSKNFSLIYLVPIDIEHTIYPMPQVVANSRKPNFESLMKPRKKPKKWYFTMNFSDSKWNFKELNV